MRGSVTIDRIAYGVGWPTVDDIPGGAQITIVQTFECEGAEKPVCVAESLARVYVGA